MSIRKILNAVIAVLAILSVAVLFACKNPANNPPGDEDPDDEEPTEVMLFDFETDAQFEGWDVNIPVKVTDAEIVGTGHGSAVAAFTYSADAAFGMTEFFHAVTKDAAAWGAMNALSFDACVPDDETDSFDNLLIVLRTFSDPQEHWKHEAYLYNENPATWKTFVIPFSDIIDAGWSPGGANSDETFEEAVSSATTVLDKITIAPVLNQHATGVEHTMYIDNIKFFIEE